MFAAPISAPERQHCSHACPPRPSDWAARQVEAGEPGELAAGAAGLREESRLAGPAGQGDRVTHCPDGAGARRVRSKSPSDAPGPGTAVIWLMLRGSPQCEHTATASTKCPHAVCFIVSGAPLGAAHWSPHWRMAVTTCHRAQPLSVRQYSERGG